MLKYFKLCSKNSCDLPLPDPGGSLSNKTVNHSTIEEASNEVTTIIVDSLLHFNDAWVSSDHDKYEIHGQNCLFQSLQRLFAS